MEEGRIDFVVMVGFEGVSGKKWGIDVCGLSRMTAGDFLKTSPIDPMQSLGSLAALGYKRAVAAGWGFVIRQFGWVQVST